MWVLKLAHVPRPIPIRSGQSAAVALLLTGYHAVRCTLSAYLRGTKVDTQSSGRQDFCAKVLYNAPLGRLSGQFACIVGITSGHD